MMNTISTEKTKHMKAISFCMSFAAFLLLGTVLSSCAGRWSKATTHPAKGTTTESEQEVNQR